MDPIKPFPDLPLADLVLPAPGRAPVFSSQHSGRFASNMSSLVASMIDKEGWYFSCGDESMPEEAVLNTDEVASPDGMLPLVLRQSALLMRQAFGRMPPMRWVEHGGSLCLFQPDDEQADSASLAIWALFCHAALESLVSAKPELAMAGEPVSMTAWRQAFLADIHRGELRPVAAPPRPAISQDR